MKHLDQYLKPEEFNKILAAEKNPQFKLAYLLGFGSGLRLSEVIGYKKPDGSEIKPLSPEQVDIQAKLIRVIGGKGNKSRIAPLFPKFSEKHLKLLPLKIPRSTLQHRLTALGIKVLGKNIHFHEFRHSFAIMSIERGVKLPYLQQALGHSRLDTTGIYTKANPKDMLNDYSRAWGQ